MLDCFDGKAALALKEVSRSTGLPESTLFRVLLTLEKHGYLRQANDGTYQLAPKLRFGWLVEQGNALRDQVHPELDGWRSALTRRPAWPTFSTTASMCSTPLRHFTKSACRTALAAFAPTLQRDGQGDRGFPGPRRGRADRRIYGLTRRTEHTITDRAWLFDEFDEICRTGVAYDREESVIGGICISAAIRPAGQPVVAAAEPLHSDRPHDARTRRADPQSGAGGGYTRCTDVIGHTKHRFFELSKYLAEILWSVCFEAGALIPAFGTSKAAPWTRRETYGQFSRS